MVALPNGHCRAAIGWLGTDLARVRSSRMSPEALAENQLSTKSDVYSFGESPLCVIPRPVCDVLTPVDRGGAVGDPDGEGSLRGHGCRGCRTRHHRGRIVGDPSVGTQGVRAPPAGLLASGPQPPTFFRSPLHSIGGDVCPSFPPRSATDLGLLLPRFSASRCKQAMANSNVRWDSSPSGGKHRPPPTGTGGVGLHVRAFPSE